MHGTRILLSMIIILATLSLFQSYQCLVTQVAFTKVVWALKTVELNFLLQRNAHLNCEDRKKVEM